MLFEVRGYFRSALLLIPLPLKWIVLKATTKTDKPLSLPFLTIFRFRPLFFDGFAILIEKWQKGRDPRSKPYSTAIKSVYDLGRTT